MKKKIIVLITLLCALLVYLAVFNHDKTPLIRQQSPHDHQTMKEKPVSIIVATDLHYLSSKLTDKGKFFTNMVNNADGKNMYYVEEITDAFVYTILKEKPEVLILSGDLTFNGEKESHIDLKKKLSKIEKNGTQILVMPGNHDVDRSSAAAFLGENYKLVDSVTKDEFAEIYQNDGLQQALQKDEHSLSYVYRVRRDLSILMVDSNAQKENVISDENLQWIETVLKEAQESGIKMLAVSHQNVLVHNPRFKDGFLIGQAEQLERLYRKYGVLANLSGHIHIQHIEHQNFPEILTSSLLVSPHQYGKITIDGSKIEYQVSPVPVERWAREQGLTDPILLQFAKESRHFMEEVAERKAADTVFKETLTDSEKSELITVFARMNADYFAGNKIDEKQYEATLKLWEEQGTAFHKNYIETILESAKENHHHIVVNLE